IAGRHLNLMLICFFALYVYRDVFPPATFTLVPMDLAQGPILWAKIIILFLVSSFIPMVIPRQYVPLDPKLTTPIHPRKKN
ncbi:hypothetical protein B0H14DRAFT_2413830, partial [Mycena olivaceomarginata]